MYETVRGHIFNVTICKKKPTVLSKASELDHCYDQSCVYVSALNSSIVTIKKKLETLTIHHILSKRPLNETMNTNIHTHTRINSSRSTREREKERERIEYFLFR